MSRILSQDEVRALLQQPVPGTELTPEEKGPRPVVRYDFREREQMPRTRLRYLQSLHERFAQYLSVSLSAYLRNSSEASISEIQQLSSRRVLQSLPDPTVIFMVSSGSAGTVAVVIDNELALSFVDRLLGGGGGKPSLTRALTEIEQSVIEGLMDVVFASLRQTWSPILDITLALEKVETRPALVSLEPPEAGRVVLQLAIVSSNEDNNIQGNMMVVLPLDIADTLSTEMARDSGRGRDVKSIASDDIEAVEARLLKTPVDVRFELSAKEVTAGDLVQLQPGHVLNLGRSLEELAVVKVGGAAKFTGVLALSRGQPAIEVKELVYAE